MRDNFDEVLYNAREIDDGDLTDAMLVEAIRAFQLAHGLKPDGMAGPKTQAKLTQAISSPLESELEPAPVRWAPYARSGLDAVYPMSYSKRDYCLGVPGGSKSDWYKIHILTRQGDNAFPGVPPTGPGSYVKVHRIVEAYAEEAFRRAVESSDYKIKRVGSFNYRPIRHGKDGMTTLSSHAFGIAFDINARDNRLIKFDDALDVPARFSTAWRELWPNGVDEAFVHAFKSCGFRWGGDYRTVVDPMHFEWVGLKVWR